MEKTGKDYLLNDMRNHEDDKLDEVFKKQKSLANTIEKTKSH